ncbi:LOW QUALITY PROTEIN: WD repeat-containing protein 63 [Anoplophora glabripennis]|uniref:LOW QUALITY PROTEIN: WD repeat-containing protein 63 n=1 Tax=Anoplophora glabripennis TaxID=217634 RepID=UPI000C762704|nr:LOW QUALITY PROTEIN: WD repeat-containing protein 63 [Anoplophora glabripennis]
MDEEQPASKTGLTSKSMIISPSEHQSMVSKSALFEHRSSGKRKKRRRRRQKELFTIQGVVKVVLSELAQKIIGCVVGVDVTTENPWTYVDKELVQDNLELHEESSEFLPIKKEVLAFPRPKILIGYVPDESRDYDEFYICVTEKATDEVTAIIEKMRKEQEERLNNAINKTVKQWVTQGCEGEVEEAIMKNNRPLIEVEVETRYPIFPDKAQFKLVRAQQRRDGYMELRSTEETFTNIYKKRIDASVQVAPRYISTEAQTNCTYPSNSATQYLYEVEDTKQLLEQCSKSIREYTNENMENISDILTVNGVLNLYSDDYTSLAMDQNGTWTQTGVVDGIKEYMSFMDVKLCKGKKIANAVWHPMWTGTVAIAYSDLASNDYLNGPSNEDVVLRAVHGVNPVLLWSTSDALKPKLILESPREVHKLSFCPFDENILIGGCKDGQIIIWDIRNKLNKVEELEVLTPAQQRYRAHMNSLMEWMKNVHDLALVRPTAISDPRYSHRGAITGITWMSPFYEISKIGNLMEIPDEWEQMSMQFMTSSEDGTVLVWDLLKRPKIEAGGYKVKKLKRLKKKPSALMIDVSPYQSLHLNLRPIYRLYLRRSGDKNKNNMAISSCYAKFCKVRYVERPSTGKKNLDDRTYYVPVLHRETRHEVLPRIHLGTMEGDYALLRWDGQDFDSGEVVNSEVGVPLNFGKYHDGPVTSLHTPSAYNVYLTAGGRIFALWRDDFKDKPILWRRTRSKMTSAKFNMFQPYMFTILLMSGHIEDWVLANSSKYPVKSVMYSSQYITAAAMHPLKLKKDIYGAGDKQGAFRLFFFNAETKETVASKMAAFTAFIDREVERKKMFVAWQDDWNKRHDAAEILHEKPQEKLPPKGPQPGKRRTFRWLTRLVFFLRVPGKFIEWMIEQRQLEREARIKSMIISKKQLDTKELEKRRKPLQKLEEENEMKKRKQKQRLKEGDTIFHNTVAALFPEVVKEKPPLPPDPYAVVDSDLDKQLCYEEYQSLCVEAEEFVDANPYDYEFDWREVQEGGKLRRHLLDENGTRRSYHDLRKMRRKGTKKSVAPSAFSEAFETSMEEGNVTAPNAS